MGQPKDAEEEAAPWDDDDDGWTGHLVAVARLSDGSRWLVDASAAQAARPQHNIHCPPVIAWEVSRSFMEGEPVTQQSTRDQALFTYVRRKQFADYTRSPDWWDYTERYAGSITLPLIRALQQEAPWYRRLIPKTA